MSESPMTSGENTGGGDVLGNEPKTWRSHRDRPADGATTDFSVADPARPVDRPELTPDDAEVRSQAMLRESLETLIKLIERVSPGMRGSVLLLEDDGITLHHGAAPHLPTEYCEAIDGASIGPSAGSCGTAVYRRERVI